MSKVEVRDRNNGNEQAIDNSGASLNIVKPLPPFLGFDGKQKMRIFRQYLTDDGTDSGSNDMAVNGSSTNVDFYIEADDEKDLYITTLSIVITEPGMSLNEWGNSGSALSNGVRIFYNDEQGEVDIHDGLKTNFEIIRLCGGNPAFGSGSTAFRATNVLGTDEGYFQDLDLRIRFGFEWGVVLRGGSKQRITFRIRDNISSTDSLDCVAYGFTREKD